jgi:hypothetical protein
MSMRAYVAWLLLIVAGCNGGSDSKVDAPIGSDTRPIDAPIDMAPPTYDTCAGAQTLTFANGLAAGTANTGGAADDTAASCGGVGGPDVVFRFTTPTVGTLLVDVRPTSGSSRAVLSLRSDCGNPATEFGGCIAAESASGGMLEVVRDLAAGTYYLWIDSADGQPAQFDISMQLTVAAGDSCAGPIPISFSGGEVNVAASLTASTNDESGSCGGGTGLDNVFRFDLAAASNVEVNVIPRTASVQPVVYLQSSCVGGDLGCAAAPSLGANAFLRLGSVPTGTQYLWIDSANATPGLYNFTARVAMPGMGDTCALASPLTFTSGMATVMGNTAMMFHDSVGTCAAGTAPDAVYTFTTTAVQNLRVDVTTSSSMYQPMVYLRSSTCTGGQLACAIAPMAGGSSTLTYGSLPIGTYYLWVDGVAGTAGPFTMTALLGTPAPGDTCALAQPLTFTSGMATATGNTSTWFHDSTGTCATGTAPDGVYTFTTSAVQDLRISVSTTTSTYQPAVYLRSTSCTGTQLGCGTAIAAGGTATLDVGALPIGTYYLWIDGVGNTAGAYTLNASLTNPLPGDHCTNTTPLVFTSGMAMASGDTAMMFNDGSGTCASGTAPDAIYSFTTTAVEDLRVTVTTTTSTYQPVVYLRSATCTGTQLACSTALTPGAMATLAVGGLPIGTYYLWIDGVGTTAGAYSLTATLTAPQPGDRCTNPTTLMFSNGAAGGTAMAMGDTTNLFDDAAGTCGGSGGPDAVYTFTTNIALDLTASVSTTTSTYRPVMYLRSASCTGTQTACNAAATFGGTASLSVLTLPAGTYFLWVDSATAAGGLYTLSANLVPLPPAEVRPVQPTDVIVPGPMAVAFEVVDRLGSVVATDNATQFTITANGSAVFTTATQGSIISGAGTNTVLVQVAGGRVSLDATDTIAETVTYVATDSQGNGLIYPTGSVSQMSTNQALASTNTFNLTFAQRPSANATLTITAFGDFSSGGSEYLDIFMESLLGTAYGNVFTTGGNQCGSTIMANVTIPQADLMTHLIDGVATIVTRASTSVNTTLCGGDFVAVTLAFPTVNSARFLP